MTEARAPGVVYFGNTWRGENRTSSHHVAIRLARRMPVLYVESPGMRAPAAGRRDLWRGVAVLGRSLSPPTRIGEGLWCCTVPQLPFRRIPGIDMLNRAFSTWAVRRAMRRIGLERPIAWFVVPHPGFLAGRLGEALSVYYCIDDYAAHPGVDEAKVQAADRRLTEAADLVFVAPPALVAAKRSLNPNTLPAPHGVDVDHFARAQAPETPRPVAFPRCRGKVVGYIGSLHEWIDLELIAWLAQQRPEWDFVLVGHRHVATPALDALPNVHMVGAQPYEDLPLWSKAFDVAIIPYRATRQVAHANPLKLREYLAAGLPVVSARNPEIDRFSEWVDIRETPAGFLRGLDAALAKPRGEGAAARMAAVADQSWERRVDEVLRHVTDAMAAKTAANVATVASGASA